jgi:CRP-like cAMP-binding protein
MDDKSAPIFGNRLIMALPLECRRNIAAQLEPVALTLGQQIEEPGWPAEYVYFVETGMISMVAAEGGRVSAEVGMIGPEGLTGSAIALGDDIPSHRTFVQIAGRANRMKAGTFRTALQQNPPLYDLALKYARVLWIQAMNTALANVELALAPRLARWILMMHDRVEGDSINITHEFLAMMLHARRPGITVAIHVLEGERLVGSTRGVLQIKDRSGLIKFADGSYGRTEAEYVRLIG